ncbi:S-layer homology domain-containing protein [Pseudoflavonifractor sp. MSJ-37]|uniref:S-layer homology domain-containing protein n=1 Tax=Pseudoflavonifractor sp. MSJ-37 TaxID=2841531 RepID=UPI001C0FFBB6|nr:S-layer homology domain-containing protein [Pseudoflavonifractor sp. MSJ-37]MBU5435440.1 S-layer homology domain-containing protein [Pseudoflavonifractor sp. MSJ-37]
MQRRSIFSAGLTVCLALSLSAPALAYSDTAGHWAQSAIQKASDYGLMVGYEDGRFGVSDQLDRASFVTVLCQMFGWDKVSPSSPSYIDCPSTHWAYGYVEAAKAHGASDSSGSFRPGDPISREEMAILLVKALGYDSLARTADPDLPFSDVTRNQGYISLAYHIGMTAGIQEGGKLLFKPDLSATRAEAAVMLTQVYERYTSKLDWVHGFYAISSYSQIGLTKEMDAVSLGWARMEYTADGGPTLNTTSANGNGWKIPEDPTAATSYLQSNGTPYNLCVFGSAADSIALADGTTTSTVAAVTGTPAARAQAVAALTAASSGYAGLTIDFEGLKDKGGLKSDFAQFMKELRAALPKSKALYVCVQPGPYLTGFDFRSLGESCDKVILMAHDYRPPVSDLRVGTVPSESFAVTPFSKIYSALVEVTDPDTGVQDRSKLALAFSMDDTGYRIDESGKVLESKYYRPSMAVLAQRLAQPGIEKGWSATARNPWVIYTDENGDRYKVWYEDARSIADKIDLAEMFGIRGVSFWRLGNIPASGSYDLWSAVRAER